MRLHLLAPLIVVLVTLLVVGLAWGLSYPPYSSSGTDRHRPSPFTGSPLLLQATAPSWNPATSCKAMVLTMEQFVGSVPNPTQYTGSSPPIGSAVGADYSGGALPLEGAKPAGTNPPSNSWPYSKRAINPPCSVTLANGTVLPTLVEIHNVQVEGISCDELNSVIPNICDWTFNVCNNLLAGNCSHTATYPDTMHKFHAEIDMNWTLYKIAPPVPTQGYQVDVQGFAFWDDAHINDQYHTYSGWELHPLSAWRITNSTGKTVDMAASPSNIGPVSVGTPGNSTITATSVNGFTGTISFSPLVPNSMGNVMTTSYVSASCSPSTITLTAGSRAASSCSFTASQPGSFDVIVLGSNSSRPTSSVTLQLGAVNTPDFALSANPTSATVNAGSPSASTVTVSALNGFAGVVNLASNSTSCNLAPTSVTGSGSSTLFCTFASAGTVHVTVTGTSGSLSHSAAVTYLVQDFTVIASATSVTVNAGATGTSTITVAPVNGFAGTVTLAVTTNSTNLSCSSSPASVTGGSGASTLSCSSSVAANYLATVTGTSGSLSHSATITFTVQDFTIAASPTSVTVNLGSAGTSSIMIIGLNGFSGVVSLTTNSTACSVSPTSLTGSGSSTLSCIFASASTIHATVTVTSGSLSHSATVTYVVQDFTIAASPTSVTVLAGSAGTSSITITGLNGFADVVSLTTNSTACTVSPTSATGSSGSTLSCTFASASTIHVTVTGTSSSLSHSATVTFTFQDFTVPAAPTSLTVNTGVTGTSTMTIVPLYGFTGTVTLATTTNSTDLSCTLTLTSIAGGSGTSALSCIGSVADNYLATVTATSGGLSHSATVTYIIQDFTIATSPTSVTVNAGVSGSSAIGVAPLNGFAGTITLAATTNSTNLSCTLTSTSITSGSGSSSISCIGSTAGNYLATIKGTNATLAHSITVTYIVQDFTMSASPTSITVNAGVPGISAITVAPVNGFTGTVALAVITNSTNLSCTLTSTIIAGGSGNSTLSCTGSVAGNYLTTVAGMSGTLSRSATVTYRVQEFTVSASPTSVPENAGVAGNSTITVVPVNGFTGTVTLGVTTNSTNLSCTLVSTSINGGSGVSPLSCTGSAAGNYLATVTGANGSLTHSITVNLVVRDFNLNASPASMTFLDVSTGSSTITVGALNGFAGSITLTFSASGLTCSVSPASVVLGVATNSTLSCSGVVGMYAVNVTGTSGPLSHFVILTVTVQSGSVGGIVVQVDKLRLLSPYLVTMTTILTVLVIAALVKRQNGNGRTQHRPASVYGLHGRG